MRFNRSSIIYPKTRVGVRLRLDGPLNINLNFLLIERNGGSCSPSYRRPEHHFSLDRIAESRSRQRLLEEFGMSRPNENKGFTLVEIAITVGILLLLIGAAVPFYTSYRGKTNVNRAVEITKAVIERAAEEAKAAGYPLPQDMLVDGLATPAADPSNNKTVVLRIRKRVTQAGSAKTIAERHLPGSDGLRVSLSGLGLLPMDQTDAQGVFLEILQKSELDETLLATLPIDVNGEFVFQQGEQTGAAIFFGYGNHTRGIQMNVRGVVVSDQR